MQGRAATRLGRCSDNAKLDTGVTNRARKRSDGCRGPLPLKRWPDSSSLLPSKPKPITAGEDRCIRATAVAPSRRFSSRGPGVARTYQSGHGRRAGVTRCHDTRTPMWRWHDRLRSPSVARKSLKSVKVGACQSFASRRARAISGVSRSCPRGGSPEQMVSSEGCPICKRVRWSCKRVRWSPELPDS